MMVEDWRAVAFATGAAERERAEAGVRAAYEAAGLRGPQRVVWAPSPAAGAIAAVLLGGDGQDVQALRDAGLGDAVAEVASLVADVDAGRSVRDEVRTRPWEAVRAAAHAELGPQEWARVWARTTGSSWDAVNGLVTRIRQGIGEMAGAQGEERGAQAERLLRGATLDAVLGQHDAPWLWLFEELGRLGELAGPAEVARAAGWWWPYENAVIICERPSELHRDEPGRLHRGDGPALAFPDGFALHAWRGMPIPPGFIDTLGTLTAADIRAEDNAELRRVMLEYYGYDRYLNEIGAKPVHRDETGVLWRIDLPDDEPVVMVEVVNSTPEPDGTYRTYHLRVPPHTRTAREGVAWTFGLTEDEYRPQKET
ncbi:MULTISPECIES: DUF6745 domain-containing protein [Thermomonospora]|uniref:DUF6745 domain-containing protein n=1 Tax=Thermomonospora TaxID=2019 RepID=UPI001F37C0F4|nr:MULTISPECIES: hypothetical protein [Thermomonospora]